MRLRCALSLLWEEARYAAMSQARCHIHRRRLPTPASQPAQPARTTPAALSISIPTWLATTMMLSRLRSSTPLIC